MPSLCINIEVIFVCWKKEKKKDWGKKFTYGLESKLDCANSQKKFISFSLFSWFILGLCCLPHTKWEITDPTTMPFYTHYSLPWCIFAFLPWLSPYSLFVLRAKHFRNFSSNFYFIILSGIFLVIPLHSAYYIYSNPPKSLKIHHKIFMRCGPYRDKMKLKNITGFQFFSWKKLLQIASLLSMFQEKRGKFYATYWW